MRFSAQLKSGPSTHVLDVDTAHVHMTKEQRDITTKLFAAAKGRVIDVDTAASQCEQGKCLASQLLPPDEFEKIRGLKVQLGGTVAMSWVVIDFCIHPVVHKLEPGAGGERV